MSSYNIFADYYDRLTDNVHYEVRSDYISDFFHHAGVDGGKLLDLACGTGSFSKCFSDRGYTVTGCDRSAEMLTAARRKCSEAEFLQCDMCLLPFEGEFDACICMLDSLNHLPDEAAWRQCFDGVYRALKSGGIFIFDVNTVYKHRFLLANNSYIFDEEDFFLAWDNELSEDNSVRLMLDFFVFNGKNYDRYSEEFTETAYDTAVIREMLKDRFKVCGVFDELTYDEEKPDSERVYFVCKRLD